MRGIFGILGIGGIGGIGGMGGILGIRGTGSIFIALRRMYCPSTRSPMYLPFSLHTEPSWSIQPMYLLLGSNK